MLKRSWLSFSSKAWMMETSSPPSNSNSGTLFTAAESESVIKYLVRFIPLICKENSIKYEGGTQHQALHHWYFDTAVCKCNGEPSMIFIYALQIGFYHWKSSYKFLQGACYITRQNYNQNDDGGRELSSEGMSQLHSRRCNGRFYGTFSGGNTQQFTNIQSQDLEINCCLSVQHCPPPHNPSNDH